MIKRYNDALQGVCVVAPTVWDNGDTHSWMLITLYSSVHNRIIRVNRPFMLRGYHDAAWGVSKEACVQSARAILEMQINFRNSALLRPRYALLVRAADARFVDRWIVAAASILAIDTILSDRRHLDMLQTAESLLAIDRPKVASAIQCLCEAALKRISDSQPAGATDINEFFEEVQLRFTGKSDRESV